MKDRMEWSGMDSGPSWGSVIMPCTGWSGVCGPEGGEGRAEELGLGHRSGLLTIQLKGWESREASNQEGEVNPWAVQGGEGGGSGGGTVVWGLGKSPRMS